MKDFGDLKVENTGDLDLVSQMLETMTNSDLVLQIL